ncbi:hypothetical protein ACFSJW_09315 [Flavobacterium artemisiae]|uniref:Uncharacterized protein n=1 Tax=Flavobacterium artemisiae TaxID=2126556 RepID=A0ABW4HEI9_9FLAO
MENLKNTPEIILKAKSFGHVLNYKWTKKTIENIIDPLEKNDELENLLNSIGHKAAMGLTAALLEWIYWRFKGFGTCNEEIKQRIEAIWSSIENPKNTKPLVFDENLDFPALGFVNGPIWAALMNVRMIDTFYKQGSNFLQSELVGLVLLARHITPKKKYFDAWFDHVMEGLIETFPNQNLNKAVEIENSFYDFSNEPSICREFFFDAAFKYDEVKSKEALHNFISRIDCSSNLFCFDQKINKRQ